jgi:hypothetical protein
MSDGYYAMAGIVGFITFVVIWIYALVSWGFLLGLFLGWIPALIGGVIIGYLWPVFGLLLLWIFLAAR